MLKQLKQRIITALILASIVLVGLLALPSFWFAQLALIFIVLLGGFEWARLVGLPINHEMWITLGTLGLAAEALWLLEGSLVPLLVASVLIWCGILYLLWHYRQTSSFYHDYPGLLKGLGVLVLIPAWYALARLHEVHYGYVLYLISLIALADISAYFTGKRFGKVKLAPELSPGKTREGAYGALLFTFIWALVWALWQPLNAGQALVWILFSMLAVAFSIAGDLFESLMKRQANVKDSGTLLPGHGGVLDRIDSLLAAVPLFTLGLIIMRASA